MCPIGKDHKIRRTKVEDMLPQVQLTIAGAPKIIITIQMLLGSPVWSEQVEINPRLWLSVKTFKVPYQATTSSSPTILPRLVLLEIV